MRVNHREVSDAGRVRVARAASVDVPFIRRTGWQMVKGTNEREW